ncbi:hypothetical protein AciPR4_3873 [Terriglobus saanensis SP1PR4]|uniref:Uncharacterized protein n=1 Tax=Terriglobus saanensis (strain ATCC BAA-1853 / DSM 23119 / SP1PR4) TaxID=401053 RepID=E8V265_TERSS|nr:hypothetical protein AciPR4_3873 [Terriglobus saanensis SP1PR4]
MQPGFQESSLNGGMRVNPLMSGNLQRLRYETESKSGQSNQHANRSFHSSMASAPPRFAAMEIWARFV